MLLQTSFTQNELIDRTKGDLGLRGSGLITEVDVTRWAMDIMRQAAQHAPWYYVSDSVDVTVGVSDYDLPARAITMMSLAHDNQLLPLITFEQLEYSDPYWRQMGQGTPYAWYRRGMIGFTLYPTPDETIVDGIDRVYSAIPEAPEGGNDTYDFPQANEQLLIDYCMFRAALKATPGEGEGKIAIYQRGYLSEMERFKAAYSEMWGEPVVLGSAGTHWMRSPFDVSHRIVPQPGPE